MRSSTYLDGRVTQYVDDVRVVLASLEQDSVDCVVCSPPYWGLRDYQTATWEGGDPACDHAPPADGGRSGNKGHVQTHAGRFAGRDCHRCGATRVDRQIGLERTLGEHLAVMVDVFRGIKRVLKPSGTVWINYGDCYATSVNGRSAADTKATGNDDRTFRDKPFSTIGGVLKAKDLCMVPNRLAIALQEAGWWVRSEIVWAKPNPMPESIRDRPATSHEKIFMITKAARYFYDPAAVRQDSAASSVGRWQQDVESQEGSHRANGGAKTNGTMKAVGGPRKVRATDVAAPRHAGHINHTGIEDTLRGYGRNLRNYEPAPVEVWNVATQPFSDAHFATFPPELAERCILAGCPKGGLVLDPFGGAGTTALVALRHHRRASLIELNPAYAEMAQARIEAEWRVQPKAKAVDFGPLFGRPVQEAAE